jgi:hypothetical protein
MVPIKTIMTTFDSIIIIFDMWFKHHGMPQFIISDRNIKFMVGFWKHLFRKVGTKLLFNITFHAQINGQTKRVNGVFNQYSKNYVNIDQKDWGKHLGLVEFCYNSTTHSTTKTSLFELKLGKETKKPMDSTIPVGWTNHSKEAMEMVKGHEEKHTQANKLLEHVPK